MKPRIEKKLSKRLVQLAPSLFHDSWIDDQWEARTQHYAHNNGGKLTPGQIRENRQARVRVNHMPSVGGGLDYWGEGNDWWTCWEWFCMNWMWHGPFDSYPNDHEFAAYPNTNGFKRTTRNLLKLAAAYELEERQRRIKRNKQRGDV
jgi:hypothetical protein